MGTDWSRIAQWDGGQWKVVLTGTRATRPCRPLVKEYGEKYAKEKNLKGPQLQLMTSLHRQPAGCAWRHLACAAVQ